MAIDLGALRVRLVTELQGDWKKALHWGSVQFASAMVVVSAGLPVLADHFAPDIAPWLLQFLPKGQEGLIGVISSALFILARVVKFEKHDPS
jgi:hypothetical protein